MNSSPTTTKLKSIHVLFVTTPHLQLRGSTVDLCETALEHCITESVIIEAYIHLVHNLAAEETTTLPPMEYQAAFYTATFRSPLRTLDDASSIGRHKTESSLIITTRNPNLVAHVYRRDPKEKVFKLARQKLDRIIPVAPSPPTPTRPPRRYGTAAAVEPTMHVKKTVSRDDSEWEDVPDIQEEKRKVGHEKEIEDEEDEMLSIFTTMKI